LAATSGLFSVATASIGSVMSTPIARPDAPTFFAAMNTSIPAPEPRSRNVSPAFRSVEETGDPQP
jgi:hypothetical protein